MTGQRMKWLRVAAFPPGNSARRTGKLMYKKNLKWILPLVGILVTTWIAIGQQNRRIDENTLKNAGKNNTDDWLMYGLNHQEQRYSLLKQIDATNVGRLGLAWTYEIGSGGGNQEATPLVFNGVLYSITNWSITFAVDARTGKEIWRYDPQVDRGMARLRTREPAGFDDDREPIDRRDEHSEAPLGIRRRRSARRPDRDGGSGDGRTTSVQDASRNPNVRGGRREQEKRRQESAHGCGSLVQPADRCA